MKWLRTLRWLFSEQPKYSIDEMMKPTPPPVWHQAGAQPALSIERTGLLLDRQQQGLIGKFKLSDWWSHDLSMDERTLIRRYFSCDELTEGRIIGTSMTALQLLYEMAGSLDRPDSRALALKVIAKAESIISERSKVLDLHFLYTTKVEVLDKPHTHDVSAELEQSCRKLVELAPRAKTAFHRDGSPTLPSHVGYETLVGLLEERGDQGSADQLLTLAQRQGWQGSWTKKKPTRRASRSGRPRGKNAPTNEPF